jgi:hypothetical protein
MGYIYQMQQASIAFLSGEPNASVVGGTASLLLELDEAQDISKAKYAKDFAPMRASRNAPAVFYGTAWTDKTLYDQLQEAQRLQRRDGNGACLKIGTCGGRFQLRQFVGAKSNAGREPSDHQDTVSPLEIDAEGS